MIGRPEVTHEQHQRVHLLRKTFIDEVQEKVSLPPNLLQLLLALRVEEEQLEELLKEPEEVENEVDVF